MRWDGPGGRCSRRQGRPRWRRTRPRPPRKTACFGREEEMCNERISSGLLTPLACHRRNCNMKACKAPPKITRLASELRSSFWSIFLSAWLLAASGGTFKADFPLLKTLPGPSSGGPERNMATWIEGPGGGVGEDEEVWESGLLLLALEKGGFLVP